MKTVPRKSVLSRKRHRNHRKPEPQEKLPRKLKTVPSPKKIRPLKENSNCNR